MWGRQIYCRNCTFCYIEFNWEYLLNYNSVPAFELKLQTGWRIAIWIWMQVELKCIEIQINFELEKQRL